MTGVRFTEEWEGKCDACAQWWPLSDEFWYPRQGVRRCRACINETQTRSARRTRAEVEAIRRSQHLRYQREWARAKRQRRAA